MIALLSASLLFAAQKISSSELDNFVRLDANIYARTVDSKNTFGSSERTNGTHRITAETLSAVEAIFEAYYERGVYTSSGPSNNWDTSEYGPNTSPRHLDLSIGWRGRYQYPKTPPYGWTNPYFEAPLTRRLIETTNVFSFIQHEAIRDVIDGIQGDRPLLDRGGWWDPDGDRKIYWSSTMFDELEDKTTEITMKKVEEADLSDSFFPIRNFAQSGSGGTMLHRRTAGTYTWISSLFADAAWIPNMMRPKTVPDDPGSKFGDAFEERLATQYAVIAPNYPDLHIYPGMYEYRGFTHRLIPDEALAIDSDIVTVSPYAAAGHALSCADRTFEIAGRKNVTNQNYHVVNLTLIGGDMSWEGSGFGEVEIYADADGPLARFRNDTIDNLPLNSKGSPVRGSVSTSVRNERVDCMRARYRFSGVRRNRASAGYLQVGEQDYVTTTFYVTPEDIDPFTVYPPGTNVYFTMNLFADRVPGTTYFQPSTNVKPINQVFDAMDIDGQTMELWARYSVSGAIKECTIKYTDTCPSLADIRRIVKWTGPSTWAFDAGVVDEAMLFSLYNLATVRATGEGLDTDETDIEDIDVSGNNAETKSYVQLGGQTYGEEDERISRIRQVLQQIYTDVKTTGSRISGVDETSPRDSLDFEEDEYDDAGHAEDIRGVEVTLSCFLNNPYNMVNGFWLVSDETGHLKGPFYFRTSWYDPRVATADIAEFRLEASAYAAPTDFDDHDCPNVKTDTSDLVMSHPACAVDAKGAEMTRTTWDWNALRVVKPERNNQ